MSIPVVRRFYIRRVLKFIDKSKTKGRRLPEGMAEAARVLARVPKHQREKVFEEMVLTNQALPNMGREMRRAASRQRKSGKGRGNRPGLPPGTIQRARRAR
jgi:hypothetical protein